MKVSDRELIEDLSKNLQELENPGDFINQSDLADKYDMAKSSIHERVKRLASKRYIELSQVRSNLKGSSILNKSKVYVPTDEGLQNYGLSREELGLDTEGPSPTSLKFYDIHNLEIKYKVLDRPDPDPLEWDKVNPMKHGTVQKIKYLENSDGEKLTIQLWEGKNRSTLSIKPKLLARGSESIEELKDKTDEMAHKIRRQLERQDGYKLGLGQKREDDIKYTIRSPELEDLGYIEEGSFTIDRSQGMEELHPDQETEKGKRVMSKAIEGRSLKELAGDEVLDDQKKIEILKEIGELGELFDQVQKNRQIIKTATQGINKLARQQGELTEGFKKLIEMISGEPDQELEPRGEPGGIRYG